MIDEGDFECHVCNDCTNSCVARQGNPAFEGLLDFIDIVTEGRVASQPPKSYCEERPPDRRSRAGSDEAINTKTLSFPNVSIGNPGLSSTFAFG